jgi:hypothetical protein
MNILMLHLKKKARAREEEREMRDPITLIPSLRYQLVKLSILMGLTIPNGDT